MTYSDLTHSEGVACTAFKSLQNRCEMLLPYFAEWGDTVEVGEISPIALKKLAIKKVCQSFVGTEGDFGFNSPQISVDSAQVSSDFLIHCRQEKMLILLAESALRIWFGYGKFYSFVVKTKYVTKTGSWEEKVKCRPWLSWSFYFVSM